MSKCARPRKWWRNGLWTILVLCQGGAVFADGPAPRLVVGSKSDIETVILGELVAGLARGTGAAVVHKQQLGGTPILWNALKRGEIDVYPEYTGTISAELLADKNVRNEDDIRRELAKLGIAMSRPLGFNNTYAIGMKADLADRLGIHTISDLRAHPDLKFGFTNEFMSRRDGWPSLKERYRLPQRDVRGLEHALAYRGLETGAIQATDLYTTDAEIIYYDLRELKDDLAHFPAYYAVLLYRAKLEESAPEAVKAFLQLEGRIPKAAMLEMNKLVKPKTGARVSETRAAADFLADNPFFSKPEENAEYQAPAEESLAQLLLVLTGQHLRLVALSLGAAILVAVPLGILASRWPWLGQTILAGVGIVQTIPSLALLVFLIPLFGLGPVPAIAALFLYSLLPIVRNTYTGLKDIPAQALESAQALGLSPGARLRLVELPMASRSILAGIKTSAVINVGTATLGGFIGAGGYGERIFTGLRLDSPAITLEGAIPAAVLALLVQGLFELAERRLVPLGLRLRPE